MENNVFESIVKKKKKSVRLHWIYVLNYMLLVFHLQTRVQCLCVWKHKDVVGNSVVFR